MIPVRLGDLGEGTKEATIKQWFVQPGASVKEVDPQRINTQLEDLCEVITDKLVAKIPSAYAGKVVKLHHKNDEICQVGQPLLDMEVADDVKVKEEVKKEEPAPTPAPAAEHKPEAKPEPGIIVSYNLDREAKGRAKIWKGTSYSSCQSLRQGDEDRHQ